MGLNDNGELGCAPDVLKLNANDPLLTHPEWDKPFAPHPLACEHGSLARQCRVCELEAQITDWIADRDSWIERYEAVNKENSALTAKLADFTKLGEQPFAPTKKGNS